MTTTNSLPLTRASVAEAYKIIKPSIHRTPVLTNKSISEIASAPQDPSALEGTPWEGQTPAQPKLNLFFKCENLQKIGAFKIRGATHALSRLISRETHSTVRTRGVTTHSSGNHAQALALAAREANVPAYIVMPRISTPTKIAGTRGYGAEVIFSGSTSVEREAVVRGVIREKGAFLVPPYDHPDIVLGQGTAGKELEEQVWDMVMGGDREGGSVGAPVYSDESSAGKGNASRGVLDAAFAPLGGGGLLSGTATYFGPTPTWVFGAEPEFEGADDGRRGLAMEPPTRVESVKSLTIADGLRTPVGEIPWGVISDKGKVEGVYAVSEEGIKRAMRLVLERMKVVVEPSACVGLAVVLFDEEWRRWAEEKQKAEGKEDWNVGIVFSGGNTSVEAIAGLFGGSGREERQEGKVGSDGKRVAENVAG
ncbi:MAG: hypothetical protein MMC23_004881 [Stictis urceolatum]|nr:hypothetical protein [Stictis urceolata]